MTETWRSSVCSVLRRVCAMAACAALGSASAAADDHHRRPINLFAVVDSAGTLVSGSGVSRVDHIATGQYEVTFTRNVDDCAYVATTANAYSQALQAYTAGGHLSDQGVYVETKNQGGGLTDGPFHLLASCDGPGTAFAVVGYTADLVRSSRGVTLNPLGFGRYEVRFARRFHENVASCAYLATVGDPENALVFNPSGVYTGSGPDARTVYIETKNPGGGLQPGVPFHLAVVCRSAPKTRVAVVASNGFLDRGSASTTSFRSAPGEYTLVTKKDVSLCATIATRGSVDQAVPYYPATVEIVPGPAPNTVGIEMRNLLSFGETPLDDAFHAAIVCK